MGKLTKTEKSWAMYDWANSAYSMTITSTLLPIFFKLVFTKATGDSGNLSTAYWGYANSIGTLLIAILAPILGTLADYRGLKKKFFTIFVLMGVIFTASLALVPDQYWMVLLFFYILNSIGFSGSLIFYDAFLVDVAKEERMDKVSSIGFAWGYIGSTIPFIICMAMVILTKDNSTLNSLAFKASFVITAIWWAGFTIPLLRNVKQIHGINMEPNPIVKSFKRIGTTFKHVRQHEKLFMFLLAYFFYIDGVNTIITMATSIGTDMGISSTILIVVLLAVQFIAFPFAILFGNLAEKYGSKFMLCIGVLIYIFITIYAFLMKTVLDFCILALLVATVQGGMQAISRSYFGKLVPKENNNEFFGFYNIFGKFAAIVGPFLVGFVTQMTGKSNYGILSVITLFIIGGLILIRVPDKKNIDKAKGVAIGKL